MSIYVFGVNALTNYNNINWGKGSKKAKNQSVLKQLISSLLQILNRIDCHTTLS